MPVARQPRLIDISWRTIAKVLAAVALVWLWLRLFQLVLVVIVATLLAVTLNPLVTRLEHRGWKRGLAASFVSFTLLALVGGFLFLTWSSLAEQARYVTEHVGDIEREVLSQLPPWMGNSIQRAADGDIASTTNAVSADRATASAYGPSVESAISHEPCQCAAAGGAPRGLRISSTSGTSATNMIASSWKIPTNDTIAACRWTMPKSAAYARLVAVTASEPAAMNAALSCAKRICVAES